MSFDAFQLCRLIPRVGIRLNCTPGRGKEVPRGELRVGGELREVQAAGMTTVEVERMEELPG